MTVQECYHALNGDYEQALKRLMSDSLIHKFLMKFMDDKSFESLCSALDRHDYEQAFRAAHTLKGVSLNMSFTALSKASSSLTEELRGGKYTERVPSFFEETKRQYAIVISSIKKFHCSQP